MANVKCIKFVLNVTTYLECIVEIRTLVAHAIQIDSFTVTVAKYNVCV